MEDLSDSTISGDKAGKSPKRDARLAIRSAFLSLFDTVPYEKINVTMISNAANVSRKAFYYHFDNKDDLVRWICITDLEGFVESKTSDGPGAFVDLVDFFICANRRLYGFALQDMSPGSFGQFFSDVLYRFVSARLKRFYDDGIGDKHAVSLALSLDVERGRLLCIYWLLSPREPSADDLSTFIYKYQATCNQVIGRWIRKMDDAALSSQRVIPPFSEDDYQEKMVHSFDLKEAFSALMDDPSGGGEIQDRMEIEKAFMRYR